MNEIIREEKIPVRGEYDIIVAGGGVAGISAALSASARGKKVLLLEKANILGGLATLGMINYFVPMCNGRGVQIVTGLAEKLLRLSAQYSWDTIPEEWKDGEPADKENCRRYTCRYSPYIFALLLMEEITKAGVELLYDCVASEPVMENGVCLGVITESKSGREFCRGKMIIDTTGDADLLRRSGMPVVPGKNFYTYVGKGITLASCKKAVETGNIGNVYTGMNGGTVNLFGKNQPEDKPLWSGLTVDEVSDYLIDNQSLMLSRLKQTDRWTRDLVMLPGMPSFRTTCRIDGDYTLKEEDVYKHFDDSVGAICDFTYKDLLYEVPLRTLVRRGFPNLITAGRCAAGEGYAWDVLRVIPPAILTGQAAGEAAALAIEEGCAIGDVNITTLQTRLAEGGIIVHFDDAWVPADAQTRTEGENNGHI